MRINTQVRLRLNHPKLNARVSTLSQAAVRRAAERTATRYRTNITKAGRIDTGTMRNTVKIEPMRGRTALYPGYRIGTPASYAHFQEYGTRAHGPVRAKFLRFQPKGSRTFVFAKWVRGVRPAKFARGALDQLRPKDFEP